VVYGNVSEIYAYSRDYRPRHFDTHVKFLSKHEKKLPKGFKRPPNRRKDVRADYTRRMKEKGLYERSEASTRRTLKSFFRLCHHNNVYADSIHFVTLTFEYDIAYKETQTHLRRFMSYLRLPW